MFSFFLVFFVLFVLFVHSFFFLFSFSGAVEVWRPEEDPSSHQLIVADRDNHRLQCFSLSTGRYIRTIGESGSGVGQIQEPWAMKLHTNSEPQEALLVTIGYEDLNVRSTSVQQLKHLP